jgi:hypothetical protein
MNDPKQRHGPTPARPYAASAIGSISVGSSFGAREPFTRFDRHFLAGRSVQPGIELVGPQPLLR